MNVCNYQRIHQPFDVKGINERFSTLFKEVCYLRAYNTSNPTLDMVLGFGNTSDKTAIFTDGSTATTIQTDRIVMQNADGFSATFKSDDITGNVILQARNLSGTIALLSDIVSPSGPLTINTQTSDYTLQLSDGDNNTMVEMDVAVDNNIYVDSAVNFPKGTQIPVASYGAGKTTIVPQGTTIILTPNSVASELTFQNSMGVLIKRSDVTDEWYFEGDIGTATSGGPQDLQSVTDIGPVTTNNIQIDNGDGFFQVYDSINSQYAELGTNSSDGTGYVALGNSTGWVGVIKADSLDTNYDYELPKASGTFAMSVNGIPADAAGDISIPAISPAGSNTEIQFNNSGVLGASSDLTWTSATKRLTTGGDAVFNGVKIGHGLNTTTSDNTVVGGGGALNATTSGIANSAFGSAALPQVTTGSYNTGVGSGSGFAITTGQRNTALGWGALFEGNVGSISFNTIVGFYGGRHIAANNNTGIGYSVFGGDFGSPDQTGTNNNAFGVSTGASLTTGSYNILVGDNAGANITTGSNNIAIGKTGNFLSATADNQLNIQNIIYGINNSGTGNTVSSGSIGIGTSNPDSSARLDVSSTSKGFLPPCMTTAQKNAISSPANGLCVYDTDLKCMSTYNGSYWSGYKVLVGNLYSSGTSVTFNIFENTTGTTFTVSRVSTGYYRITANSGTPFTNGKTQIFTSVNVGNATLTLYSIQTNWNTASVIEIRTADLATFLPGDDILQDTPIEIKIYP